MKHRLLLILPLLAIGLANIGWAKDVRTVDRDGIRYVIAEDGTRDVPFTGTYSTKHDNGVLALKGTYKDGELVE